MRYILISILSIILVFLILKLDGTSRNDVSFQNECITVLDKYVSNHPNNLKCELHGAYGHGGLGSQIFTFTPADNSYVLNIEPDLNKYWFTDKNGNLINQ